MVTEAAARLAAQDGLAVHVVHAREAAVAGDVAVDGEDLAAARALVRSHLDQLATHRVAAEGQILLHASDHGAAGRMVAEYANAVKAATIVIGAPSHGGLPASLDESMSREVLRTAQSNVLIVNPDAPLPSAADRSSETAPV
jgi:nucleotide-binding universal stress UspA family protein